MPFPSLQSLNGVTINGANTVFTVGQSGTYRVRYHVLVEGVSNDFNFSVQRNGTTVPLLSIGQAYEEYKFDAETYLTLAAGDTLELRVSQVAGPSIDLVTATGNGATFAIEKIG